MADSPQDAGQEPISPADRHAGTGAAIDPHAGAPEGSTAGTTTATETAPKPAPFEDPVEPTDDYEFPSTTPPKDDADTADESEGDFNDTLLQRAVEAGIPLADARNDYTNPEALERAIEALDRRPGAREDVPQESDDPKPEDFAFKINLNDEVAEPEVRKQMQGMADHFASLFHDLMTEVEGLVKRNNTVLENSERSEVERLAAAEGAEYTKLMSNGGLDRVLEQMDMARVYADAKGRKPASTSELFRRAVYGVFGDKHQAVVRRKITSDVNRRRGQAIRRPARSEGGRELTGEEKAVRSVAALMHERDLFREPDEVFE